MLIPVDIKMVYLSLPLFLRADKTFTTSYINAHIIQILNHLFKLWNAEAIHIIIVKEPIVTFFY